MLDPLAHLGGGLVGERDREDLTRPRPPRGQQVADAVREDPRLARAGSGDDEQRSAVVQDRLALLGVQPVDAERRPWPADGPVRSSASASDSSSGADAARGRRAGRRTRPGAAVRARRGRRARGCRRARSWQSQSRRRRRHRRPPLWTAGASGQDDSPTIQAAVVTRAPASSTRIVSPVACSAATVDRQAVAGVPRAQPLGEEHAEHEPHEQPDDRDHEEARRCPAHRPTTSVENGTPARFRCRPGQQVLPDPRQPRRQHGDATTRPADRAARDDAPHDHGRGDQEQPGQDLHDDADQADEDASPTRTSPRVPTAGTLDRGRSSARCGRGERPRPSAPRHQCQITAMPTFTTMSPAIAPR